MSEPEPFPTLHQSEIDDATLRQLFDDIRAHTEVIEVIPKYGADTYVPDQSATTLDEGMNLLLGNSIRALQIRYQHAGTIWWDTLMPAPRGAWRIIRMSHE